MQLVGIARLASESELLEAKRKVEYFEIPTRSLLNRTAAGKRMSKRLITRRSSGEENMCGCRSKSISTNLSARLAQ